MIDVSIFTATFNRAGYLPRLFESLLTQTILPKEWVIVDDGSTDNTSQVVESFRKTSLFPIIFSSQENAGKHIAINKGAELSSGTLFFMVDSDDYLDTDAINLLVRHWEDVQSLPEVQRDKIIGVAGNNIYPNREVVGGNPSYTVIDTDLLTFRYKLKIKGDKAEAYALQYVKNNPFPRIEGETFCPEALVFYRLANEGYQLRFINESIYVCEYLEGGLSQSGLNTIRRGPHATLLHMASIVNYDNVPLFIRIKHAILFWRFSFLAKKVSFGGKCKMIRNKIFLAFYPVGIVFYLRDKLTKK